MESVNFEFLRPENDLLANLAVSAAVFTSTRGGKLVPGVMSIWQQDGWLAKKLYT